MKRTTLALSTLLLAAAVQAAPSVYPTGVTRYDPAKAWNSYVIFSAADLQTRLIDMNGNVVRDWPYRGFPAAVIDPAANNGRRGDVLLQTADTEKKDPRAVGNGLNNQAIGVLDWDGKKQWEWSQQAPDGAARQHHDWQRLANGNTLLLSNKLHKIPGFALEQTIDDVIYEVDGKGQVVWQWLASDHLGEFGFTEEQLKLVRGTEHADVLHLNNLKALGPNAWYDKGDKRFHPDNLIIDSREANFIAIIDKPTGKVVWSLGPNYPKLDARNSALPRPVDQLSGQHDANLIAKGLPGAGNILVFDNQGSAGYPPVNGALFNGSRVLEIDPISKQIVWEYNALKSGQPSWAFNSSFISSARRLPNGNTLIAEGMNGRFFQVTPAGEIVWEYVNPYLGDAPGSKAQSNWSYRATPVPYDWVPAGTPRSEQAVVPPTPNNLHVSK